jgi:hypothetical protein
MVDPSAQDSLPHPIVQVRKRVETVLPVKMILLIKWGWSNMHRVMLALDSLQVIRASLNI